jgi:hypothetical protein
MSTPVDPIQTFATQEAANLTAVSNALTSIVTGITALDTLIQQLQNQGTTVLSPGDQSLLDQISAQSAALVTQATAVSTAAPVVGQVKK